MELLIRNVDTFDDVVKAVCVDKKGEALFAVKQNTIELSSMSGSAQLYVRANLYVGDAQTAPQT